MTAMEYSFLIIYKHHVIKQQGCFLQLLLFFEKLTHSNVVETAQ